MYLLYFSFIIILLAWNSELEKTIPFQFIISTFSEFLLPVGDSTQEQPGYLPRAVPWHDHQHFPQCGMSLQKQDALGLKTAQISSSINAITIYFLQRFKCYSVVYCRYLRLRLLLLYMLVATWPKVTMFDATVNDTALRKKFENFQKD